jgi:formimidoylglutamate deiminase
MADQRQSTGQIIEAELTWTGERFERGVRIAVDDAGRISAVGKLAESPTVRLPSRAILPGFVNVHSHAFQRGLRGRGETFPHGAGSFWTWREAMYALVQSMDEQRIYELSHQAFTEMLRAGITTVGEFHYLHHDATLAGFAFDEIIVRAAADAGIRLALLNCYYRTGGVNQPLAGGQLRFRCNAPGEFWSQIDRLAQVIDLRTQSLGVAPHSIRAAHIDEIASMTAEARRRGMVVHMHVEEQPKEIADCVAHYGRRPMSLVVERVPVDDAFTAVHCTHTSRDDMTAFLDLGGHVCLCPLTEGNLGDGIPAVPQMLAQDGRVCLGSDSNARLSFIEEMRWLEYVQRLATQSRGVCADEQGSVARRLLTMATRNGADALGIKTGSIESGHAADFVAIDLQSPSLDGFDDATLLEAIIFGCGNDIIAAACVGGRWFEREELRLRNER